MRTDRWIVALIVVLLVATGIGYVHGQVGGVQPQLVKPHGLPQTPPTILPGTPTTWVAFRAKITITDTDGSTRVGRFWRDGSGSTAYVTGEGTPLEAWSINNNVDGNTYIKIPNRQAWIGRPQRPTGPPPLSRAQQQHPVNAPPPLYVSPELDKAKTMQYEGLTLYQLAMPTGGEVWVAPALNLYTVILRQPNGGGMQLSDIQIAERGHEPQAKRFLPPPNATIEWHKAVVPSRRHPQP